MAANRECNKCGLTLDTTTNPITYINANDDTFGCGTGNHRLVPIQTKRDDDDDDDDDDENDDYLYKEIECWDLVPTVPFFTLDIASLLIYVITVFIEGDNTATHSIATWIQYLILAVAYFITIFSALIYALIQFRQSLRWRPWFKAKKIRSKILNGLLISVLCLFCAFCWRLSKKRQWMKIVNHRRGIVSAVVLLTIILSVLNVHYRSKHLASVMVSHGIIETLIFFLQICRRSVRGWWNCYYCCNGWICSKCCNYDCARFFLENSETEPLMKSNTYSHGLNNNNDDNNNNNKLELGNVKLELGNDKLELGNVKLESGNDKLELGNDNKHQNNNNNNNNGNDEVIDIDNNAIEEEPNKS